MVKAPPITVRCDCGEKADVAYGDQWTCERCGRRYDTRHIPEADYRSILALRRRYRMVGWALVGAVALLILVLALSGQPIQVLAGLPLILVSWFLYVRPMMRRRFLRSIADRPRWKLSAEGGPERRRR